MKKLSKQTVIIKPGTYARSEHMRPTTMKAYRLSSGTNLLLS